MKSLISFLIAGALALASCSKDDPAPIEVGNVKLNKTTLTLSVGEQQTLTAEVTPAEAEDKTVSWRSSDEKIATVDDAGLVTGVAAGTATITATAGGKSATCAVTVEPVTVESVTVSPTELTLRPGESETLTATVEPADAADKTVAWSTSDEAVATVSEDGLVTAVAPGDATITARAGGRTAVCAVTVEPIAVESIELDKTELTLRPGEDETLTATVLPDDATDPTVEWLSSDVEVATVSDAGVVTAVAPGTTVITATAGDKSASCMVTVEPIAVESIELDKTELTLHRTDTETLTATVLPVDAMDLTPGWGSSDERVATVSDAGVVTAVAPGTAMITATAGDKSATCTVTVEPDVYVVGYDYNVDAKQRKAYLWKNGEPTALPFTEAYSVFVSEGNVYIAGKYYENNIMLPALWQNGKLTKIRNFDGKAFQTNSVFVTEGDVYAAGSIGLAYPAMWKNGQMEPLAAYGDACSVFVTGQDVYVGGCRQNGTTSYSAVYWKNGTAVDLTDGAFFSRVWSIAVANGVVYAAGTEGTAEGNKARLWTDGVATPLEGYSAFGVAVSEKGDVYVVGTDESSRKPVLWENGERTILTDNGAAYAVFVYGDDVYVAGNNNWDAVLWKNGVMENLPEGYEAKSVFVY